MAGVARSDVPDVSILEAAAVEVDSSAAVWLVAAAEDVAAAARALAVARVCADSVRAVDVLAGEWKVVVETGLQHLPLCSAVLPPVSVSCFA